MGEVSNSWGEVNSQFISLESDLVLDPFLQ